MTRAVQAADTTIGRVEQQAIVDRTDEMSQRPVLHLTVI